jgi:hypothetical protein
LILAPVQDQVDPDTYEKLAASLNLLMGIDPVVVMTDIADVTREEALDALEWSARALVEGALAQACSKRRSPQARRRSVEAAAGACRTAW